MVGSPFRTRLAARETAGTLLGVQLRARAFALVLLGLAGCGAASPPDAPTLQLPFTSSPEAPVLFNGAQGVIVGTTGSFGFGALNAGTQSLTLQTVIYAGDPAMSLQPFAQAPPATLSFNQEFLVPLACAPPALASYPGTVTVTSNAVNTPVAVVYITCVGMPPSQSFSGVTSTLSR